jgi:hypothetical protein
MLRSLVAPLLDTEWRIEDVELPPIDDPLLIATAVAAGAWLLLLAAFAFSTRSRRVEAGPPTTELLPEPPAIVNLLVNGSRVTPNAVQATLLDLAARDYIDVEEYDAGEHVICRLKQREPGSGLEPYTRIVLDHIRDEAVDGVIVAQALTTGEKGKASAWWKAFRKAVVEDAKARGLSEDRWGKPQWGILRLAGLAAGGLFVLTAARANAFEAAILVVLVVAASLNTLLIKIFGDQRLKPAGFDEAAHWLGVRAYLEQNQAFTEAPPGAVILWDRYMAYAAAMGLATKAIRALPMGVEDDRRAWSAYGGRWREVRVSYPRTRIVWGRSPFRGMLAGLAIAAAGAGLAWLAWQVWGLADDGLGDDEAERWVRIGSAIAIAVGLLVAAWGAHTLGLAFLDLGTRREIAGEIIRRRRVESRNEAVYFLALDDGKADKVKAWRVSPQLYSSTVQGDRVTVVVSPRLGYVHRLAEATQAQGEEPAASPAG